MSERQDTVMPDFKAGDIVECIGINISCERDRIMYAKGEMKEPLVVGNKYKVMNLQITSYGNYVTVVGGGICVEGTYASQFAKSNWQGNNSNNITPF